MELTKALWEMTCFNPTTSLKFIELSEMMVFVFILNKQFIEFECRANKIEFQIKVIYSLNQF